MERQRLLQNIVDTILERPLVDFNGAYFTRNYRDHIIALYDLNKLLSSMFEGVVRHEQSYAATCRCQNETFHDMADLAAFPSLLSLRLRHKIPDRSPLYAGAFADPLLNFLSCQVFTAAGALVEVPSILSDAVAEVALAHDSKSVASMVVIRRSVLGLIAKLWNDALLRFASLVDRPAMRPSLPLADNPFVWETLVAAVATQPPRPESGGGGPRSLSRSQSQAAMRVVVRQVPPPPRAKYLR